MAHPAILIGLASLGVFVATKIFRRTRIFVSYYYRDDSKFKNLLTAWSANRKFALEFEDASADVSIKSKSQATIKRVLSRKIGEADVLLVLVGKKSHRRRWISWEIAKAKELGKRIVAVKISSEYQSPKELLACGAVWAKSFEFEAIRRAIEA